MGIGPLVVARSGAKCSEILEIVRDTHRSTGTLPQLALILAGTNDCTRSATEIVDNIENIHAYFHTFGVPTVALSPPCGSKYNTVNNALLGWLAGDRPLVWAHIDTLRLLDPSLLCCDRTHFLPAASRTLGATLASVTDRFFSRTSP